MSQQPLIDSEVGGGGRPEEGRAQPPSNGGALAGSATAAAGGGLRGLNKAESWKARYLVAPRPASAVPGLPAMSEGGDGVGDFEAASWHSADYAYPPAGGSGAGAGRYGWAALWLALLAANYGLVRGTSALLSLPEDGTRSLDPYALVDDLTQLLAYGGLLGWFTRAVERDRLAWLLAPRQWYFPLLFLGTPPVYGLISELPGMQHSFADISDWPLEYWAVEILGLGTLLAVAGYHVRLAARLKPQAEFWAYLGSRLAVFALCALGAWAVLADDRYRLHLHHYWLGWGFALFFEFNTPLSAAALAIVSAIYCQGVGAYGFAHNLSNPNCFTVRSDGGQSMLCAFNSTQPFDLQACPTMPNVHVDGSCLLGGAAPWQ